MNKITLYGLSSTGKPKEWSIWTEGGYVCQEWGFVDGKKQETKDLVKQKNIGKSNETSLEEQAELEAQRKLIKKKEEGFSENLSTSNLSEIDWENAILPDSFAPSKPAVSIDEETEKELIKKSAAYYTRKWNGMRCFVVIGDKAVKIYSRRIEDKTENFPHHIKELEKCLGQQLILDCEMILDDDPDLIKEVFGAKPDKAIERQNTTHGVPKLIGFDILYKNGKHLAKDYATRYRELINFIEGIGFKHLECVKILDGEGRPNIPKDWEGLVLWDANSVGKIRFDGKPDRRSGAYKIKNFKEADLICKSWEYGKGRLNNDVATLNLGAYDKNNEYVAICQSGSGLTDELRRIIKQKSPQGKFVDLVFEIKYEERTPGGSLRLPIILRLRDDKKPSECKVEDII